MYSMKHLIQVEGVGDLLTVYRYMGYVITKVQMPGINLEVEAMFFGF